MHENVNRSFFEIHVGGENWASSARKNMVGRNKKKKFFFHPPVISLTCGIFVIVRSFCAEIVLFCAQCREKFSRDEKIYRDKIEIYDTYSW